MTDGEKMVWAAAFVANRMAQVPLPVCAEKAWRAVLEMENAREVVREGYGTEHGVYFMLGEMLR